MSLLSLSALPLPQKLALAHAPVQYRGAALAAFALDARLAQFVLNANEPMVVQLRLAWWREELAKPMSLRAKGDPVLDALGSSWQDDASRLTKLVDGWERILSDGPFGPDAIAEFCAGRGAVFAGLAKLSGHDGAEQNAANAGRIWAGADLAAQLADSKQRKALLDQLAGHTPARAHLPRALRHLEILAQLAEASIRRGGTPLLDRRSDYLKIIRIGLLGR